MKLKNGMVAVLLAIAVLLTIAPVTADEVLLNNLTINYGSYDAPTSGALNFLVVQNYSVFAPLVKKITITGAGLANYSAGDASYDVEIWDAGSPQNGSTVILYGLVGHGHIDVTGTNTGTYFGLHDVVFTISDLSYAAGKSEYHRFKLINATGDPGYKDYATYSRQWNNVPVGYGSLLAPNPGGLSYFHVWSNWGDFKWYGEVNYQDVIVNVKSNTTGLNIPRVDVTLKTSPTSSISGKTDLDGNVLFGLVADYPRPLYINASKAGYQPASIPFTGNFSSSPVMQYLTMNDVTAVGGTAEVFLDIADVDTGEAITGATVGIQNLTATIDQWRYGTFSASTLTFNTTGLTPEINLSVGQNIAFAGYKSGVYEANNTGTYQIPSPISHLELLLKKVVGNTSAHYHYPVTITDATTGNAIGDSTLKTAFWSGGIHSNYYNSTSATGKFNVTGVGPGGQTPLKSGDIVLLYGNATGYEPSGFYLTVDDETNGVTQYVNLAPSSLVPLSGEFTALVEAYDADTTQALQGVSVVVRKGGNSTSATTGASGIAKFKNLTAGDSYSLTATKTGYTQLTKTFMGGSGLIVTIDAAMSSVGVNPTYSITTTPTSNASAGAMNEKGAAGLIQLIDYLIMVSGMVFVGLMIIFWAKVVRAVRDALGI